MTQYEYEDARGLLARTETLLADADARARDTAALAGRADEALEEARAVRRRVGVPLGSPPPGDLSAPASATSPDRARG